MQNFDVVIVGAGAAGLFCAGVAGQLGLKVLVLDHSDQGGRKNPHLGRRALQLHQPGHQPGQFSGRQPAFLPLGPVALHAAPTLSALMQKHQIAFHEKHKGQLFCDHSAEDIINMLLAECAAGGVTRWQPCAVKNIRYFGL